MSMVMPLSVEEDLDRDEGKIRGGNKQNSSTMLLIGREICFLLAIGFTTYAAIINSETNSSRVPFATPFFRQESMVGDFYNGELTEALFKAYSEADLLFVMYYAPWDAESQAVRWEFEALAQQHYKQVYFAAINCWHPAGECRRTLSKVQQYPKFVAYITHEKGIEYRGPRTVQHMSRFLDGLIRPIERINTNGDLLRLRATHNVVVVGYINFEGTIGGTAYRTLYEAALKLIKMDMSREVTFAVVTSSKTASDMFVDTTPTFRMYLWNETLEYHGAHSSDNLADWIVQNLHQITVWLTPPGIKSLTLAPYMRDGPVLLMFTPSASFYNYDMLREISLEYNNCQNYPAVSYLARYISDDVVDKITEMKRLDAACKKQKNTKKNIEIPVQVTSQAWSNISCAKNKKQNKQGLMSWAESSCPGDKVLVVKNKSPTISSSYSDHLSSEALTQFHWEETCRRHRLVRPVKLPQDLDQTSVLDPALTGLACHSNKTVTFLVMDSNQNAHFADGLGIDLSRHKGRTVAVIINSNLEMLHVLTEVNRQSLTRFLLDYTAGKLERFLRTEARESRPINRYALNRNNSVQSITLPEIMTGTFQDIALNNSQNVVVFYHSSFCAFCHGVSYVYLAVARLMRNVPQLVFARLDGENNDLPWEYTVHHYPSILFFPARRKADSRMFPQHIQVTINNLAQFVLANLELEHRLLGMLDLCSRWNSKQNVDKHKDCIIDIRRSCLNSIADTLSRYRMVSTRLPFNSRRQQLLKTILIRLQYLKSLHLFLGTAHHNSVRLTEEFLRLLENESKFSTKTNIYRFKDEL